MKWLFVITLVIIDPYAGIDYSQVNSYDIETEYCDDCIGYTESEGWGENQTTEDEEPVIEYEPPQIWIPWRY